MRSSRANHNAVAVSAYGQEVAINTFHDLDLSLLAAVGDIIKPERRRENNANELTGKEEADTIYDNGQTSGLSLSFEKAQPQHFGFLYSYALGGVSAIAAGNGYLKTITPMQGDVDRERSLPSFTAAQRLGKTIAKQRWASMFIDQVTATFAKDAWCKVSGTAKGTGKMESSIVEESISAAGNAIQLTLATSGVEGTTAMARLDSVHQIRCELTPGVWTEVDFSAVSSATPAVITITAPGVAVDVVTYKVLYAPTEEAWMTFPSRISETPLRVSEVTFRIGGAWNGTTFVGGREMGAEVNSLEHTMSNNGAIEFSLGAGGAYASQYFREGRTQTLKLDREFRDYIIQNYMDTNEVLGASILAEGAEYEPGHKYSVEIIFPMLGILSAPISANGKRLAEAGDLSVLEHDTYGSVIVKVKNLQAIYAA